MQTGCGLEILELGVFESLVTWDSCIVYDQVEGPEGHRGMINNRLCQDRFTNETSVGNCESARMDNLVDHILTSNGIVDSAA